MSSDDRSFRFDILRRWSDDHRAEVLVRGRVQRGGSVFAERGAHRMLKGSSATADGRRGSWRKVMRSVVRSMRAIRRGQRSARG